MKRWLRAMTLVEIVVATSLIALALFFMITILPTANMSLRQAEDLESANMYGQEVLESVRLQLPNALPTVPPLPMASATAMDVTLNNQQYREYRNITQLDTQPSYTDLYYLYELQVILAKKSNVDKADKVINMNAAVNLVTRETIRIPNPCPNP